MLLAAVRRCVDSVLEQLVAGLCYDEASKSVARNLLQEVTGPRYTRWGAYALCVSACIKGSLWACRRYCKECVDAMERMYPMAWSDVTGFVDTLLYRVISHLALDSVRMVVSLIIAHGLQRVAGHTLPPRFASFFHLCDASCGVSFHRTRYVLTSCCPPLIQMLLLLPPRGTLTEEQVHSIEDGLTVPELLAVEVLPTISRTISGQICVFLRSLTGDIGKSSASSNPTHTAWIASLITFAPAGHLRHALSVPLLHLAPLLLLADVIAKASPLAWLTVFTIGCYCKDRGVVCSTVLPASYLVFAAYSERCADEEVAREHEARVAHLEASDDNLLSAELDTSLHRFQNPPLVSDADGFASLVASIQSDILALNTSCVTLGTEDVRDLASRGERCAICQGPYEEGTEARKLPCEHLFHVDCVDEWLRRHPLCPLCRRGVGGSSSVPWSEEDGWGEETITPRPDTPNF